MSDAEDSQLQNLFEAVPENLRGDVRKHIHKNTGKMVEKVVKALFKPIIVHPGWKEVPENVLRDIRIQRLQQVLKGEEGEATDAEALAYLSSASMVAPMRSEWVRIYEYVFQRYLDWNGIPRPEFLREDIKLSKYEESELKRFRIWLWDQAERAWKEKMKKMKKEKGESNACTGRSGAKGKIQKGR